MSQRNWFFEVYTKGPNGENGWDIQVGYVVGVETRHDALKKIDAHFGDQFDVVIQCYPAVLNRFDNLTSDYVVIR